MSLQSRDNRIVKQSMIVILTLMVLVFLMDIIQFSLDREPVARAPMTPWEQCMIWNKWSEFPRTGSCPGDFQARYWRK